MKTLLPLYVLVLSGVGVTMVPARVSCVIKAAEQCLEEFKQGAKTAKGKLDDVCRLLNAYKECEKKACPDGTIPSIAQNAEDILKQYRLLDCSHASHFVSAQTMPVLLLFIIGLFFGVF